MATNLYDTTAGTFERMLTSTINIMNKGAQHCEASGIEPQTLVESRIHEDMMPLHFQVVSVVHHSLGALQGVEAGEFSPPSFELDKSFSELQQSLEDARTGVQGYNEAQVIAMEDKDVVFRLGERSMPFEGGTFLKTFSVPNFYFHVTTTYDILRAAGVKLGKMDFLGGVQLKGQ